MWRDGGLKGEVVQLPWKQDQDEWPVYPVMNDIVTVLHGSEWMVTGKPSKRLFLFKFILTNNQAIRFNLMDDQCEHSQACQEKKFWCVNATTCGEEVWRDTFANAVKRCELLRSRILTLNVTQITQRLLKGESAWTGSRRFNEYAFFLNFLKSNFVFRSHFIREDGALFDIEYLPSYSQFPGRVQLQVTEKKIYTRNTHSDANNDVTSDDCLCFLSYHNLIAKAFLEQPVNLFVIATIGLILFGLCFTCQNALK